MQATPIDSIPEIVQKLRKTFNTGKTKDLSFRKRELMNLFRFTQENSQAIEAALWKDLRKHKSEIEICEFAMINSDIALAIDNLDKWAAPQYPEVDLINKFDGAQIHYEPLGVVLIIGAWNYPIQLTLVPLVGAIAAGNCAVIKPSEISSHTAQLLADLLPKYLDPTCFQVINGGVPETTKVLQQRFDHIMYTGNSMIGKIVMKAAAEFLTPVTLELGGKSPTIVLDDADPKIAGRRITWGKFMNCGQTCIAPDYILCSKEMQPKLIQGIQDAVLEFYGSDPKQSDSYGRMVNKNHFKRVASMIEKENVAMGGVTDENENYIAPTILINQNSDSPSMKQEIFGPILPFVTISSVDEAIEFINRGEKPLALYVFGKNSENLTKVLGSCSSGSAATNDCLVQATVHSLPFGGVGNSGMGAYHGKLSFDVFSHKKAVMRKNEMLESVNSLRYPPYTEKKLNLLKSIAFKVPSTSKGFPLFGGLAIVGTAAAAVAYLM